MATLYDLNKTAVAAADKAFTKPQLEQDEIKVDAFKTAQHDEADYPAWLNLFQQHTDHYKFLQNQFTPATLAAQKAAQAAAIAAQANTKAPAAPAA